MKASIQSLRVLVFVLGILTTVFLTPLGGQEQPKPAEKPSRSPAVPQQGSQPVFKATTRLVLVDVVATNGKGEPVTDLEAEDFTVLEDGQIQQISAFNLQTPAATQSGNSQAVTPLPPNTFSNVPRYQKTGVWNVLLLDFMNSQVPSQADLRQQLVKILDRLPDEPLAVYLLTDRLTLLQDFTQDREALKQLIADLKNYISKNLDNPKGGHESERYPAGYLAKLPPMLRESVIRSEAQATGARTQIRVHETVDALNKIVRNLAALPGRKNLIWVSQAFPLSIEPGATVNGWDAATKRQFEVSVPRTANALLDSQVAIYPVDPSGLHMTEEYDAGNRGTDALGLKFTSIGPNNTVSALHNAETVTHGSVNELAERTGGRAFYNWNDIGDAIMRSMHDGSTYYTLSYYPSDKTWNGKFRQIRVKVKRDGVKLRYRSGYFAVDSAAAGRDLKVRAEQDAQFREAMELDTPVSTSLLFNAKVLPAPSQNSGIMVDFRLLPGSALIENGADGLPYASVECAVRAFNEKGEPANAAGNTMSGALKPAAYASVSREGFPCRQALDLPPGDYLLRLGVRDKMSGRMGTADATASVK